ncbi:MAG: ion transporter [Proteobacteria bacterium]|nr:ion transporter [Pseudomonadota bacterium]
MVEQTPLRPWQRRLYTVIFEADTPAGRAFDVGLLVLIAVSVVAVLLESVEGFRARYGDVMRWVEWGITGIFTVEYVLRLACVRSRWGYATSFFGVVDLLAIAPTYLGWLWPGSQSLLVIRALRLLRLFRVLKLGHFLSEANLLLTALRSGRRKVSVFLGTVLVIVLILGSVMYLVEGPEHGFTSIPRSVYWAVVTVTTVGYGDLAPQTVLGQFIAAIAMVMGYSIIAVPTGIFTAEIMEAARRPITTRTCPECTSEGHAPGARYCQDCGARLLRPQPPETPPTG